MCAIALAHTNRGFKYIGYLPLKGRVQKKKNPHNTVEFDTTENYMHNKNYGRKTKKIKALLCCNVVSLQGKGSQVCAHVAKVFFFFFFGQGSFNVVNS